MAKMFVHYNGTVELFKSIASLYDNKIVFIKGGDNGEGAAIYTHGKYYGDVKDALAVLQETVGDLKYFTSIKAGETTASATGKNGIITFNASDPTQVSVNVDSNGVNIGLSKDFTDAVATNTADLIKEINRATEAEDKISTDLGQKTDTAAADGSAFAQIALLKSDINSITGGSGSIATQITNAIGALDVDAQAGDYVASVKQVDGKIEATMGTFNFDAAGAAEGVKKVLIGVDTDTKDSDTIKGAKKYADQHANIIETVKVNGSALNIEDKAVNIEIPAATVTGVKTSDKILSMEGTEVVSTLSFGKETIDGKEYLIVKGKDNVEIGKVDTSDFTADSFLDDVIIEGQNINFVWKMADGSSKTDSVDLSEYIKPYSNGDGLNLSDNNVFSVKLDETSETFLSVSADGVKLDGVQQAITNAVDGLADTVNENERVTAKALTDLDSRLLSLEGKNDTIDGALQTSDITTGGANGTIAVKGTDVVVKGLGSAAYTEASAYATADQGAKADAAAPQATTYTKDEVDAMWVWEEL